MTDRRSSKGSNPRSKPAKRRRIAPVVYVTGKGGAGKTFVAEALADTARTRGLRTALVARQSDSPGDSAQAGDGAERIFWTPNDALGRLLLQTVRFRFLANRLLDSSTFTSVADAAPGVGDIAFLALIDEVARGQYDDAFYDLVVVDAPASGHSATVLGTPGYVRAIAAVGPAAAVLARTEEMVTSAKRFRPLVVCPPEELAVVETAALSQKLREDGIAPATVVANATFPAPGNEPQLRWMREHDVGEDAALFLARFDRQVALLARLRTHTPSLFEIPRAFDGPPTGVEPLLEALVPAREKRRAVRRSA